MFKFGGDDTKIGNVSVKRQHRRALGDDRCRRDRRRAVPDWTTPESARHGPDSRSRRAHVTPADDIAFMNGGYVPAVGRREPRQLAAKPERALRSHRRAVHPLRRVACARRARTWVCTRTTSASAACEPACGDGSVTYVPAELHRRCALVHAADTRRARATRRCKPTTADQLDLTYEWYFSSTGSFTTALFYKKFNDYIQYGNYIARVHQQRRDAAGVDQRTDHR